MAAGWGARRAVPYPRVVNAFPHLLEPLDQADDLLHDVFLKACQQGEAFCAVGQPRAWLFEVARNTFLDHCRRQRPTFSRTPAAS